MNETSFRTTSTVFMSDMSEQLKYEQCHCLDMLTINEPFIFMLRQLNSNIFTSFSLRRHLLIIFSNLKMI